MDLFLFHSLILIWVSIGTARHITRQAGDQVLISAVLTWSNLVATRLLLVSVDRLGDPAWLLIVSLLLATVFWWSQSRRVSLSTVSASDSEEPGTWAMLAYALTLMPLAVWMLSRVFLGQPGDPDVLKAFAWPLTGLGLYRLGRVYPLEANPSLALSWLGLVAAFVIARFDPTAHVMLATFGLVASLVFSLQWKQSRRPCHALLGMSVAFIAVGGLSGYLLPDLRWSGPHDSLAAASPPASDHHLLYFHDLILAAEAGPVATEGLRPAEGPYPLRNLPRFRSVRQPSMRLIFPAQSGVGHLHIRYSFGLLQRDKTEIEVLFNGRKVKQSRLSHQLGWIDETLDLIALPGENVLEFVDIPIQQELDWRGYLERYPDVMLYLASNNIPLEEGALEHYELSGRPEGRIMLTRKPPPPIRGAYHFVFRLLQVEGLR